MASGVQVSRAPGSGFRNMCSLVLELFRVQGLGFRV